MNGGRNFFYQKKKCCPELRLKKISPDQEDQFLQGHGGMRVVFLINFQHLTCDVFFFNALAEI